MAADHAGEEHRRRLAAAEERIYSHPAYVEHQEVEALAQAIGGVFVPNGNELIGLLAAAATNEELAVELVQNVRAPTVRDEFQARTVRALHNYLASSASLVDHVRRLMRDREGEIAERFKRGKKEVLQHPEMTFVHDLRNFTLHRKLPFLSHSFSITRVDGEDRMEVESEVLLSTQELLAWDKWTSASRRFLASFDNGVPLRPIFSTHLMLMVNLNALLCNALGNAIDYDEINELAA